MTANDAPSRLAMSVLMVLMLRGACAAQTISFTFDDGFDPRQTQDAAALNQQILDALRTQSVTAMLFPAPAGAWTHQRRSGWWRSGRPRAMPSAITRTPSDTSVHQVSIQEFTADVERAHRLLSHVPTWMNRLRFPYHKEGDTPDRRDGMRDG